MLSKLTKWIVLRCLGVLRRPTGIKSRWPDGIFRILLVKQSERLGNIILLNSALNAISSRFPEAKIDLLLPAAFCDLMADDCRIDRVIPVEKRTYFIRSWRFLSLLISLRKSEYSLAVDFSDVNSHSLTGALYTLLSGGETTAGWKTGKRAIFDIEAPRYREIIHASEMYLRLISEIFGEDMRGEPYFPIGSAKSDGGNAAVGINCGGRGNKRWPIENFIEIGRKLSAAGISSEFILGPQEQNQRAFLRDNLPQHATLLPPTPLSRLKKIIGDYSLFISSDTGPMHLAWSLRVPTLAIFVDSELEKFKPLSPGSVALDARTGLSPQTIYESAVRILNAPRIPA